MTLRKFILGEPNGDKSLSFGAKIEKADSRKANILKFGTIASSTAVIGDEVKYYDLDVNYNFGGYIQKITDQNGIKYLEVGDYYVKATQTKVNIIYTSELIEDMLADLIATYTDWTIVTNITTGITVNKMPLKDEWLNDSFNKILDLVNGAIEVDKNKNVTIFIRDSTPSGKSLIYGTDSLQGGWETDISRMAEKVIVRGAFIDQRTTETLTGTGTVFYTTYIPENIQISGKQQTTSNIAGDYIVDKDNRKITFNTSQTNPTVSYTYKSQIRVETSTELINPKTVLLEKKYLETRSEARKLAREYYSRFQNGAVSSRWYKNSSDIDSYTVGNTISVTDDVNSKTGTYTIKGVTLELPKKLLIDVGDAESDLFDQNKETIERIKQLEQINNNQDYVTTDDYIIADLNVTISIEITELTGYINDGKVLWASEDPLDTNADLISDTGNDEDYAIAYNDGSLPVGNVINYLL